MNTDNKHEGYNYILGLIITCANFKPLGTRERKKKKQKKLSK